MSINNSITIFYSWQSDLPVTDNQKAIRDAIKKACTTIEEKKEDINFINDEATSRIAGSPDIPFTIFEKISNSDIFIADITTINSGPECKRKTPNPNVLLELGYAISNLGWERIIMLYNKKHGDFNTDLPFDLEKRRAIIFLINGKDDTSGKGNLTARLTESINSIIENNPSRNYLKQFKSFELIKRDRDIISLNQLLSCLELDCIDNFIEHLPDKIHRSIFTINGNFNEIYKPSTFHIYDSELKKLIEQFDKAWENTLSHGRVYHGNGHESYTYFNLAMDEFLSEKDEKEYYQIQKEAIILKKIFRKLIKHIRETYIEIDLDALRIDAAKKLL